MAFVLFLRCPAVQIRSYAALSLSMCGQPQSRADVLVRDTARSIGSMIALVSQLQTRAWS